MATFVKRFIKLTPAFFLSFRGLATVQNKSVHASKIEELFFGLRNKTIIKRIKDLAEI